MLRPIIALLFFIIANSALGQTTADRANLEAAFRKLDLSSRQSVQSELQKSNLYHQSVDGLWGNGTESALLAAHHTLNDYDLGMSLRSIDDASYFLSFIAVGSAQKFLFGEGDECDGCDALPAAPQQTQQTYSGIAGDRARWGHLFSNAGTPNKQGMTFLGVHWGMSDAAIIQTLGNNGFPCRVDKMLAGNGEVDAVLCGGSFPSRVSLLGNSMFFGCGVFNICNYSTRQVAQTLLDQGIVGYMEPSSSAVTGEKWCGVGRHGDKVCVVPNAMTNGTIAISLNRDQFGSAVSFN